MKLLLVRHGKAEDRSLFTFSAKKDALRALTESGRRDMRKATKGLRKIAPDIDLVATSPLVRARQTAEIVADIFGAPAPLEQSLLSPGSDPAALLDWLERQSADVVALVGHEPDLGQFACLLLSGKTASSLTFKKGACALIEFVAKPIPGRGTLSWLLQPGQLRKLD
jgi:phosphohistidine phosphatase